MVTVKGVPMSVINLAMEAKSPYNDGWTQQKARDILMAIRDYINWVLKDEYNIGGDK